MNRLTPTLLALLLCITAARADDPYKEGIRDYHSGLCYRARPYLDGPPEKAILWERGFRDAQRRDRDRVNRSHCRPSLLSARNEQWSREKICEIWGGSCPIMCWSISIKEAKYYGDFDCVLREEM